MARLLAVAGSIVALVVLMGVAAAVAQPALAESADRRVALVIGNGAYHDLGDLPNPPNDASDMAKALEALDFEVISVVDGDIDALHGALRKFGRSAVDADMALFYFAGHGIALDGENYLVPVGATIEVEPDLFYEALSLTEVQRQLEFTQAPLKMVILDACRNNPLTRSLQRNAAELGRNLDAEEGLARMEVALASGLLIAYATAPGSVALDGSDQRNSPFTAALLNNIAAPQVDARVMFGRVRSEVVEKTGSFQTPWVEDGMLGEFEFNPVAAAPEPLAPSADIVEWQRISASDDPAVFEAFRSAYPDSFLASTAQDRLALLRDPGGEAKAWEALAGRREPERYEVFLRRYPSGAYASLVSFTLQQLIWKEAASASDPAAMQRFLERFPDSPYADLARVTMNSPKASQAPMPEAEGRVSEVEVATPRTVNQTAPVEAAPPVSPAAAQVSATASYPLENEPHLVQYALSALGFYDGAVDGKLGPASQRAVVRYQMSVRAPATGTLSAPEVVALVAAAAAAGEPNSQVAYGLLLARGAGAPKDDAQAAEWFEKAADAGNGFAQFNLGVFYLEGRGVPVDETRARALLGQAAVNGIPEAQAELGAMAD